MSRLRFDPTLAVPSISSSVSVLRSRSPVTQLVVLPPIFTRTFVPHPAARSQRLNAWLVAAMEARLTACDTVREVTRSVWLPVGSNSSQNFDSSSPVLEQNSCWCCCISGDSCRCRGFRRQRRSRLLFHLAIILVVVVVVRGFA